MHGQIMQLVAKAAVKVFNWTDYLGDLHIKDYLNWFIFDLFMQTNKKRNAFYETQCVVAAAPPPVVICR